jgi:hypothetical protein
MIFFPHDLLSEYEISTSGQQGEPPDMPRREKMQFDGPKINKS